MITESPCTRNILNSAIYNPKVKHVFALFSAFVFLPLGIGQFMRILVEKKKTVTVFSLHCWDVCYVLLLPSRNHMNICLVTVDLFRR